MLKNKRFKIAFFFLTFFIFLLGANFALAVSLRPPEVQYPPIPFSNVETPNQFIEKINNGVSGYALEKVLPLYVRYFYSLALMLSGLIAFGAIFWGGVLYAISAGNPAKMAQAREQITSGVLGLIILLASYLILSTVNPQLTVFQVPGLTRITQPTINVPPIQEGQGTLLMQVPTGRIIERALLDTQGVTTLDRADLLASTTRGEAEKLNSLTLELKALTAACSCGTSVCSGPSACGGIGCGTSCDINAIDAKKTEIQTSIDRLQEDQRQITILLPALVNDYLEFSRAGLLMSAPLKVMDYNSMLGYRYYLEQLGQKVQITSEGFPKWDDASITVSGRTVADPATFYFSENELGNRETIDKARGIFINLDAPFLIAPPPPGLAPPGGPPAGGGTCSVPTEGLCSIGSLSPVFGDSAPQAGQLCNKESGGNQYSFNRGCELGYSGDYSVGLFQINLTPRCPGAFIYPYEGSYNRCLVIDEVKAKECMVTYGYGDYYLNNIQQAYVISGNGSYWCPWSTACPQYCNLCGDPSYTRRYCGSL